MGLFSKIGQGLNKTRASFMGALSGLLRSFQRIDESFYEELEEILVLADVGVATAGEVVDLLRQRVKQEHIVEPEAVKRLLKEILLDLLGETRPLSLRRRRDRRQRRR